MASVRWKLAFSLILFHLLRNTLSAQVPGVDQVDCRDPLLFSTPFCQQNASRDFGNKQSTTDPNVQQGQKTVDRNGQVYIDTAGTDSRQQSETQRQGGVFPPDPIIDLQRLTKVSTGETLPVFGRDLFQRAPSTFAPADQVALMPDYVIGPGDQILLRLWGHDSLNSQLTVDTSGSIYVPQVGAVQVAGLRFDQLQQRLNAELSHTFRNFNLSVNLGHLRSLQVYLVGEARRPGVYTVSSLSTVLNALLVSGGPNVQGSMRRIQVQHEGQPAKEFDVYDLILRGDKSKDIRLQPGDTIFIPPVGPQVALAGSVRHPAIYELQGETTVSELLALAGGYAATAAKNRLTVERIDDSQVRKTLTVNLDTAGLSMHLRDGDVLYVNHITRGFEQTVTIRGNLANPGRFPWHKGMRLSEIIPERQALLTSGYWRDRNLLGVPAPLFEPMELSIRSGRPQMREAGDDTTKGLSGQQQTGNERPFSLAQSDGSNPAGTFEQLLTENRQNSGMDEPSDQQRNVQQNDRLPGTPTVTRGSIAEQQESVANLNLGTRGTLNRIELPAPEIDWSYAVIERLDPNTLKSSLVPFNLGRLLQSNDSSQDLELQPEDVITILSQSDVHVPLDEQTKYVRLEGELSGAGTYSVQPNETLYDVVQRAGGLTSKAYLFGSSFSRETARILQQQRLDEYVRTLSIDMERSAAVRAASSVSNFTDPNALAQQRTLIEQLKQLRATGRIVLEFNPNSIGMDAIPRIPLENGDTFRIPSKPLIVSVIGAVYGQNVFVYDSKRRVAEYVLLAGKPNRIADWKHAFIIRADGSIFSRDRAQGVWSNTFAQTRVNPGDTIVVPEKLIKPSTLRQVIDYSQIFSQFALGAAAINVVR